MVKAILMIGLAGCTLSKQQKTSCNVPKDCLDGYACENGTCVPGPDGGRTTIDSSSGSFEYGDVQALAAATSGVGTFPESQMLAGVDTSTGGLGCALLADESAAPGMGTALAYAKIYAMVGDVRCPNGTFAIMNDPGACISQFPAGVRPGCGLYKRWDASGVQVANRLAIGGYVHSRNTPQTQTDTRCDVDLSLSFQGGITIAKTYTFHYNPLGPEESFCVP